MKDDNLPGAAVLSAYLLLFGLVFTTPLWIEAVLAAVREGKPADWLGFAGNVVSALAAVGAATFAWSIAQKQIRLSQQQSAVIAYQALCGVLQNIVAESLLARAISSTAMKIQAFFFTMKDRQVDEDVLRELEGFLKEFDQLWSEFVTMEGKPWGGRHVPGARARIQREIGTVWSMALMVEISARDLVNAIPPQFEHRRQRLSNSLNSFNADTLQEALRDHTEELQAEGRSVRRLIDQNYQSFID